MNASHFDHIDTVFLQLSFAVKLWHFLDDHPIEKDSFDMALKIKDPWPSGHTALRSTSP
jgi:hypothetical protein